MSTRTRRPSHVEEDRPLAKRLGVRLRTARTKANLTQAQLAAGRYTTAYVSALENGLVKPSMAALAFFAERLQLPVERLLADEGHVWTRLEADLRLAAGDWQEAVDAFSTLLEAGPPDRTRADLLAGLAEALGRLERGEEAVRAASEAEALFRAQGRPVDAARVRYWEASGLYIMEQGDQAAVLLQRILDEIAAGLPAEPDLAIRALIALAVVASRDDTPERALGYLEQARSRIGDLDDRKYAVFLFSLALNYREIGDFEAAISTGTQSLARFRSAEAEFEAASVENELALVYLALGSLDTARSHLASARTFFEHRQDDRWLSHVTDTAALIALASGSNDEAITLAGEALRLAEASGNKKAALDAALTLARSQRAMGDLPGAASTLERAAAEADELGRRSQLQAVLGEWSDVMAATGDMARAYELSRQALNAGRH
jgi:tetratricopeptide (TPR) repeat protein